MVSFPADTASEEPAQHSYHSIIIANPRHVGFPDGFQQVTRLVWSHCFRSDVALVHEAVAEFFYRVVIFLMGAFGSIPVMAPQYAFIIDRKAPFRQLTGG